MMEKHENLKKLPRFSQSCFLLWATSNVSRLDRTVFELYLLNARSPVHHDNVENLFPALTRKHQGTYTLGEGFREKTTRDTMEYLRLVVQHNSKLRLLEYLIEFLNRQYGGNRGRGGGERTVELLTGNSLYKWQLRIDERWMLQRMKAFQFDSRTWWKFIETWTGVSYDWPNLWNPQNAHMSKQTLG